MTTFVEQLVDGTQVSVATQTESVFGDGRSKLRPDEMLFGKPAKDVREGVYSDEGLWLNTFAGWLSYILK